MRIVYLTQVWPEPRSSAAGLRSWNLIRALSASPFDLTLASAATSESAREELTRGGVRTQTIALNRSSFDEWIAQERPDAVIYDRFLLEEQFGARVALACPTAARILDTVDLNFLRRARQNGEDAWRGEDAYREIASIYRCDHTWVVSDFELDLLRREARVPDEMTSLSRLSPEPLTTEDPDFERRAHFASIGNFRHAPNLDSVRWTAQEIWPRIRAQLPAAQWHVYGAYPPRAVMDLHRPADGLHVHGWAEQAAATLSRYRVTLAPLRYGAGIKGKVLDGWCAGTPVVTTPIGSEGMTAGGPFPGAVGSSTDEIARAAVQLHEDRTQWEHARQGGFEILVRLYAAAPIEASIRERVRSVVTNLEALRAANIVGRVLELSTLRSTLYFSRWIEAKEVS